MLSHLVKIFVLATTTLCVLCCFALWSPSAYAVDAVKRPKQINIVYDDSGSMVKDHGEAITAWAEAHYAIEVFATMLGENDVMKIYTMGSADRGITDPDLVISGSDNVKQRAELVHAGFLQDENGAYRAYTNFNAAVAAADDLRSQPGDVEKWLVILSDGEFNVCDDMHSNPKDPKYNHAKYEEVGEAVREYMSDWANNEGINVEYVALGKDGSDNKIVESDRLRAPDFYQDGIPEAIVRENGYIFGRVALPGDRYNSSSGELDIDIPVKSIVVFAQGKDVSIGKFSGSNKENVTQEFAAVRYADAPEGVITDESLQGQVAVITPLAGEGFDVGSATIRVKNAEKLSIYYQPYVNVELCLENTESGDQIFASTGKPIPLIEGEYVATYKLLDPFTGKEINSPLIESQAFSTRLVYENGKEVFFEERQPLPLGDGNGTVVCQALINGETQVENRYETTVMSKSLKVEVVARPDEPLDVHTLNDSGPFIIRVTGEDESPLTKEQWESTTIESISPKGDMVRGLFSRLFGITTDLDFDCRPGAEVSTFEICLKQHNGEPAETRSGNEVPLHFRAIYQPSSGQSAYGEADEKVNIKSASWWELLAHWFYLHWIPILITLLIILFLTWLLAGGRISKRFQPTVKIAGRTRKFDGPPPKAMQPFPFRNKWKVEKGTPAKLGRLAPDTPDRITLRGVYWKSGRTAEFTNYADWYRAGWRIRNAKTKSGKKDRAQKRAKKGKSAEVLVGRNTTLENSRVGYSIRFWNK